MFQTNGKLHPAAHAVRFNCKNQLVKILNQLKIVVSMLQAMRIPGLKNSILLQASYF